MSFLAKVGAKSAAFINHKPFHPGSKANLEKAWEAEQKESDRLKRQKDLIEQRKKEIQIDELKKAMRKVEKEKGNKIIAHSIKPVHIDQPQKQNTGSKTMRKNIDKLLSSNVASCYKEDVFPRGHSSVWGSYYNKGSGKWGFRCCQSTSRGSSCSNKSKAPKRPLEEDYDDPIEDVSTKRIKYAEGGIADVISALHKEAEKKEISWDNMPENEGGFTL